MFNLIKFGLHFSHMNAYGVLDPMVLELIREERVLRRKQEDAVARTGVLSAQNDAENQDDLQHAA